jgi:hypothetical protein
MKNTKGTQGKTMTVRVDDQTEMKFGLIWNILQTYEPPQIRLSRNDVFAMIVKEYYQVLKREDRLLRDYIPTQEIE